MKQRQRILQVSICLMISCAYRLLLTYELTNAVRFEYLIRLRTDGMYDASQIQIHETFNKIHGLVYKRFLPEQLVCDHFYIANRYLALGGFHNAYPLMKCDELNLKHCGRLPMPETECLLKRRIEFWGGQLEFASNPKTVFIERHKGKGPVCGMKT